MNTTLNVSINLQQAGELRALISERFPEGRDISYAWCMFNLHFRTDSYKHLPSARFNDAVAYIPTIPRIQRLADGHYLVSIRNGRTQYHAPMPTTLWGKLRLVLSRKAHQGENHV